jgi:transcriptional regulator with XRE-family HTH domain
MPNLGQRIRELRAERDISLRELAKQLGVSPAFISDVELGRRYPSEPLLSSIAKLLKVKVEELKALDERPPIDELKRAAEDDPHYGLALRTILDSNMSGDELIKLFQQTNKKKSDK